MIAEASLRYLIMMQLITTTENTIAHFLVSRIFAISDIQSMILQNDDFDVSW
jgi:hypothetical protein